MIKVVLTMLMVISILISGIPVHGEELKPEATAAMETAGFSPYPGSVFCTGTVEQGMRFATSDSPEAVRKWFVDNLVNWSLSSDEGLGMWSLFDGPVELKGKGQIFAYNNVSVNENSNLPEWHNLSDNMTTEILVALPRWNSGQEDEPLLEIPPLDSFDSAGLTRISKPDGIIGSLDQAEDMQSSRGGIYYYLQDENYNEYTIAFEADLAEGLAQKMESISYTYESVRIVGDILADEENGFFSMDRSKAIKIYQEK